MMREGFAGEAFSGFDGGDGDGYTSQPAKYQGMRKLERGAQLANNEFVYDQNGQLPANLNNDVNYEEGGVVTYDDTARVQRGPVTLKNGATYTGQWLNNQRDGYGQ